MSIIAIRKIIAATKSFTEKDKINFFNNVSNSMLKLKKEEQNSVKKFSPEKPPSISSLVNKITKVSSSNHDSANTPQADSAGSDKINTDELAASLKNLIGQTKKNIYKLNNDIAKGLKDG